MKEANARRLPHIVLGIIIFCALGCAGARAAAWHGLEPLKSRLADVERELGKTADDVPHAGALRYKVAGGTVTVTFVTAKFVATKKLSAGYEGTVLEVVLQHTAAADTPDSLGLTKNNDFEREERGQVAVFRDLKAGISYTFIGGRLSTTRYAPAAEQLARARATNTGS